MNRVKKTWSSLFVPNILAQPLGSRAVPKPPFCSSIKCSRELKNMSASHYWLPLAAVSVSTLRMNATLASLAGV